MERTLARSTPGMKKTWLVIVFERFEKLRREHIAVTGDQRNQNAVGPAEFFFVLQERLHVLVFERQLLFEPRFDLQTATSRTSCRP